MKKKLSELNETKFGVLEEQKDDGQLVLHLGIFLFYFNRITSIDNFKLEFVEKTKV